MDTICGDLFSSLRQVHGGLADIVLFNPPYVPTESRELKDAASGISAAWAGGIDGREVC